MLKAKKKICLAKNTAREIEQQWIVLRGYQYDLHASMCVWPSPGCKDASFRIQIHALKKPGASRLELYLGFAFKTRDKPRPWRTNDPSMFQHDRDKSSEHVRVEVLRKALLSHPTRWDQRTLPHSAFGSPPKWSTRKFYSDETRNNFFFLRTKSTQDHWRRHPRNREHPLRFRAESILGYDIMCNGTIAYDGTVYARIDAARWSRDCTKI